jgi:hypothetical protein
MRCRNSEGENLIAHHEIELALLKYSLLFSFKDLSLPGWSECSTMIPSVDAEKDPKGTMRIWKELVKE